MKLPAYGLRPAGLRRLSGVVYFNWMGPTAVGISEGPKPAIIRDLYSILCLKTIQGTGGSRKLTRTRCLTRSRMRVT